jgi:TM2 domain-containing membrane protein YozV
VSDDAKQPLEDPVEAMREQGKSPELAAVLAWLLPGAGHLYAGHFVKGSGGLVLVLGLFLWGLFLSNGEAVSLENEQGHPYAFLAQIGAGAPTLAGLAYAHGKFPGDFKLDRPRKGEARLRAAEYARTLPDVDSGLLFTMIAGLLNLLLIHDALGGVPGGLARRQEERRRQARLDALRAELAEAEPAAEEREPQANAEGDEADAEGDEADDEGDEADDEPVGDAGGNA